MNIAGWKPLYRNQPDHFIDPGESESERLQRSLMKAKPKREPLEGSESDSQAAQPFVPINCWQSAAIGITAYIFEESEAAIRQSGLVPDWVSYPNDPGAGVAVPAHHDFPSYLKLLRLKSGHLRLIIDVRAVFRGDAQFQRFLGGLTADKSLSLVKREATNR